MAGCLSTANLRANRGEEVQDGSGDQAQLRPWWLWHSCWHSLATWSHPGNRETPEAAQSFSLVLLGLVAPRAVVVHILSIL